jgi:hypothetical protein
MFTSIGWILILPQVAVFVVYIQFLAWLLFLLDNLQSDSSLEIVLYLSQVSVFELVVFLISLCLTLCDGLQISLKTFC